MKKIDALVFKFESFDSESLIKDVINYSHNSLIILCSIRGLRVVHQPSGVNIRNFYLGSALPIKNIKLRYFLYPFTFLIDHFMIMFIFLRCCLFYQVKVLVVDTTSVAVISGVLRKLGLVEKSIYWCGDWFAGNQTKVGIWSNIGNNFIFPIIDYLACKFNDLTLDITQEITKSRNNFWGKQIPKKNLLFQCRLEKKGKNTLLGRKKILFLGNLRKDSGLEIVLSFIRKVKEKSQVKLKLIGGSGYHLEVIKEKIEEYKISDHVEILGFTERSRFKKETRDCFCGINLLTGKGSYSAKTLPAKIFDYIQYLLPIIVTNNLGIMSRMVLKNNLGQVINPSVEELTDAVLNIYKNQGRYRDNMIKYIESFPGKKITDFFSQPSN